MKKLHRFTVFDFYVDVIEHLEKEDYELAHELAYDIIMYGIYWKTPSMNDVRLIDHRDRIKDTLEKFRNKSLKRLKHWVDLDFEDYDVARRKAEEEESIEDDYWELVRSPIGTIPWDEYFTSKHPLEWENR